MDYLQERANAHFAAYPGTTKLCVRKLAQAYSDLGLSKEEQLAAFDIIASTAEKVWTDACESVDIERQAQRDRVDKDLKEVHSIRESLGDDEADVELAQCQEEANSPRVTLRSLHERVLLRLEHWKKRRAERLAEYEAIMAVTSALKTQLGQAQLSTRPDLSRANLDFLRMEQEKLVEKKESRVNRLTALLEKLHESCLEIGENSKLAMSQAHPSLRTFRESRETVPHAHEDQAVDGVLKLAGSRQDDPLLTVDLSDAMFDRLQAKIQEMLDLKAEREANLQALATMLDGLWDALGLDHQSQERAAVSALFHAPDRLHSSSAEACMAEVARLEQQQAQAMKDLVVAKARELEALCAASLMTAPDVSQLLVEMSQAKKDATGQIAEVLSKLVRMISEVQAEATKRCSLVAAVSELEQACEELAWLHTYENDENRFKGRQANSNLQRSIRAVKLRDRVPSLIKAFQQQAQGWRLKEGAPFLVNGKDYAEEILPAVSRDLEQSLAEKAAPRARTMSGGGSTATSSKATPTKAAGAQGMSSSRSGARPPSVPSSKAQPHALSPQGLADRHSIAVPLRASQQGLPRDSARVAERRMSRSSEYKPGELSAAAAAAPAKSGEHAPKPAMRPPQSPAGPSRTPPPASHGLTPPRSQSSISKAAAAASPGKDLMKEKMDKILEGTPTRSPAPTSTAPAKAGMDLGAQPSSKPVTPLSTGVPKALFDVTMMDVEQADVCSPKDTRPKGSIKATTPKSAAPRQLDQAGAAGGIKPSRIPRFGA